MYYVGPIVLPRVLIEFIKSISEIGCSLFRRCVLSAFDTVVIRQSFLISIPTFLVAVVLFILFNRWTKHPGRMSFLLNWIINQDVIEVVSLSSDGLHMDESLVWISECVRFILFTFRTGWNLCLDYKACCYLVRNDKVFGSWIWKVMNHQNKFRLLNSTLVSDRKLYILGTFA